jgi:hypothetical protein
MRAMCQAPRMRQRFSIDRYLAHRTRRRLSLIPTHHQPSVCHVKSSSLGKTPSSNVGIDILPPPHQHDGSTSSTSRSEPRPKGVGWLPRVPPANSIITSRRPPELFIGTEQTNDNDTLHVGSAPRHLPYRNGRTKCRVVVTRARSAWTMRISILEMGDLKAVVDSARHFDPGDGRPPDHRSAITITIAHGRDTTRS